MHCGLFFDNYKDDERIWKTRFVRISLGVFLLALIALPPFMSNSIIYILNVIGIFIIGAHGLNLLTGYTGQISLGHGAFMGVGAYASGILATKLGLPFLLCLPLAGLITAAIGMIFGIPSLRIKGLYLAIATMAAQFIIEYAMGNWTSLTGGSAGLLVPPASIAGFQFDTDLKMYYLILFFVIIATIYTKNITRTRVGRAFVAIRDRYLSAEMMGISLYKYRLMSFAISSFMVGVSGSLWAHYVQIISDEHFTIWLSIQYLAMVIIGGLGHVLGGIFGTIFMVVLPELLRIPAQALSVSHPFVFSIFNNIRSGVFGLVIVLFLIFEPDGLAARWRTIKAYWKLWPFSY